MSYTQLNDHNSMRKHQIMNVGSLRWAIKCYSRVLRRTVWVVLKYPYDNRVESTYLTVKKELGLTKNQRGRKWQIWPDAFKPADGSPLYDVHAPMGN
jgi:hypothetical protein